MTAETDTLKEEFYLWRDEMRRDGFDPGPIEAWREATKAAEARLQPLIEAARAYRDAHAAYIANMSDETWWKLERWSIDLGEAARTFEVSHIEEDDKGGE